MSDEITGSSTVSWPASALFDKLEARVEKRFDQLEQKSDKNFGSQNEVLDSVSKRLDGTATKQDVAELHRRIDGHDQRIGVVEAKVRDELAVDSFKSKVGRHIGWVFGVAGGAATLAMAIAVFVVR